MSETDKTFWKEGAIFFVSLANLYTLPFCSAIYNDDYVNQIVYWLIRCDIVVRFPIMTAVSDDEIMSMHVSGSNDHGYESRMW